MLDKKIYKYLDKKTKVRIKGHIDRIDEMEYSEYLEVTPQQDVDD